VGQESTEASAKTIMNSDTMSKLMFREFDADGKVISEIKFGSEEFLKNPNLNIFGKSYIHGSNRPMINIPHMPTNQSIASMEDIADQVISLNAQDYFKQRLTPNKPASGIEGDMNTLVRSIFGANKTEHMDAMSEIAHLATREARSIRLTEMDEAAGEGSSFLRNYNSVVKDIAEKNKDGGTVGFKIENTLNAPNTVEEHLAVNMAQGIDLAERDTSDKARYKMAKMFEYTDDSGETRVMGAAFGTGTDEVVREGAESLERLGTTTFEEGQKALRLVEESAPRASKIPKNVSRPTSSPEEVLKQISIGRDWMKKNKGTILIGAAISTAAFIGYRQAKKNNENELYEDTISPAPFEQGQRPYAIQEALESGNAYSSKKRDPLMTAGIVGNLDRQKIGHTSMSSTKNNHLFGE